MRGTIAQRPWLAGFNCSIRPASVKTAGAKAVDDAGLFLDQWGMVAKSFSWLPGDLFDVTRGGRMGLAWFIGGGKVRSIGMERALLQSGQVYDRVTRQSAVDRQRPAFSPV